MIIFLTFWTLLSPLKIICFCFFLSKLMLQITNISFCRMIYKQLFEDSQNNFLRTLTAKKKRQWPNRQWRVFTVTFYKWIYSTVSGVNQCHLYFVWSSKKFGKSKILAETTATSNCICLKWHADCSRLSYYANKSCSAQSENQSIWTNWKSK